MATRSPSPRAKLPLLLFAALAWGVSSALAEQPRNGAAGPEAGSKAGKPAKSGLGHSGRKQKGKASYYSRKFSGKKMADGTPMNPESNAAASRTLPLGTRARVTNLRNGKSAVVEIRDRGPYVPGRSIDVTPRTARELGMTRQGVAQVEITPLQVPQPEDGAKPAAD